MIFNVTVQKRSKPETTGNSATLGSKLPAELELRQFVMHGGVL